MPKLISFMRVHSAGLSSLGLLIVVGTATAVGIYQRQQGGFWEIRYVELLSFAGTSVAGAWVAYFVSKRLAAISGKQQMVMARLSEIDVSLKSLHGTWVRHCDAPSVDTFRDIRNTCRSLGVLISSVADLDGIDAEDLRDNWIRLRKVATMDISESRGMSQGSLERTTGESSFDACRISALRLAGSVHTS